jgi:hypothetical protein
VAIVLPFLAGCDTGHSQTSEARRYVTTIADKNYATITIPGDLANPTELVTLDLGYVAAGDLIRIDAFALLTKEATAGDTLVLIRSSGTGQVLFAMDTIDLEDRRFHPANTNSQIWLSGIARVVASGEVMLHMRSASAGSNAFVSPSRAQMRAYIGIYNN